MKNQLLPIEKQNSDEVENFPLEDEPRWHVIIALFSVGALYATLPDSIAFLPRPVLPALAVLMLVPLIVSRQTGRHRLNQIFGYILNFILTLFLIVSVALLVDEVVEKTQTAAVLLRSAGILWITNVIVFALWYWRLDAGGPHRREKRPGHPDGAFLFPQMTLGTDEKLETGEMNWSPNFVDYLFLAFNTSTALSPTDAPVLSRWAKMLMITQSLISLIIIVLLAARAINVL